jgi:hypothetical protein
MANTLLTAFSADFPITLEDLKNEVAYIHDIAPTDDPNWVKAIAAGWRKVLEGFRAMNIDPARFALQEGVQMYFDSTTRAWVCATLSHILRLSSGADGDAYSMQAAQWEKSFNRSLGSVKVVEESGSTEIQNTVVRGRLTR